MNNSKNIRMMKVGVEVVEVKVKVTVDSESNK